MTLILGLIVAPLIFIFRDKEKLLMGAFLLSLPVSMGFKIIERFESTNSVVKLLFQVYLSDVFLIFLFLIWIYKVFLHSNSIRYSIWKSKLFTLLLLWICMAFVSLIPAIDRIAGLVGIFRMVRIFLTFVVVFYFLNERANIHFILNCLFLALLIQALLMFAQYATNSLVISFPGATMELDIVEQGLRPSGTMGHSSHFAKFSGLVLPLALAYVFFSAKLRNKLYVLSIWACGSIALIFTISRAGLIAWLLSMIIFFAGIIILRIVPVRLTVPIFIKGTLLIFIGVGILYLLGGDRLKSRIDYDYGSAFVRIPMYKVAFNVIKAHPITGVGLNNYTLVHQDYDYTHKQISFLLPDSPVHNLFLLYAAEIGIVGLLFFLWFVLALLKRSIQCANHTEAPIEKAIYLSIAIGVVNLLLQSATGKGVTDHLIHLSVIAIFAACVAVQSKIISDSQE